mgnify:CR=1 FL=1
MYPKRWDYDAHGKLVQLHERQATHRGVVAEHRAIKRSRYPSREYCDFYYNSELRKLWGYRWRVERASGVEWSHKQPPRDVPAGFEFVERVWLD